MKVAVSKRIAGIIRAHRDVLERFEEDGLESLAAAADAISRTFERGGRVYICGNGGSAADAQHIAAELVNRFESHRPALPAVALTTDCSIITSIANDDCYDAVFARQVEATVKKGDVLWAISTSGRSPSIIAAARCAKKRGACVIAFTGRRNSPVEKLADVCVCADSDSVARSQEIHQLAYHIICRIIDDRFTRK